jgi:hypothetical protein
MSLETMMRLQYAKRISRQVAQRVVRKNASRCLQQLACRTDINMPLFVEFEIAARGRAIITTATLVRL